MFVSNAIYQDALSSGLSNVFFSGNTNKYKKVTHIIIT